MIRAITRYETDTNPGVTYKTQHEALWHGLLQGGLDISARLRTVCEEYNHAGYSGKESENSLTDLFVWGIDRLTNELQAYRYQWQEIIKIDHYETEREERE